MKKIINYFYDVRKEEWFGAGLMFLLHFLLMVSLYLLKPARDSLFLSQIGPKQLPFVYLLLAGVAIPISLYVSQLVQKYQARKVLKGSLVVYVINLLILRWLFSFETQWIYTLFYIWVGIFGILVISQFWLYANALFNAAQSKRLFPFLNLGAILGAIAGSEATTFLVWLINLRTENLLYISTVLLGLCWVLMHYIGRHTEPVEKNTNTDKNSFSESTADVFKTVFKSRYQLLLAAIIGMAMLVSTLIDYQFKSIATESFPSMAGLTTFMGNFYGGMSVASLLIQIVLSAQVVKRLGVGGAVLTRPVVLMGGAVLFLIEPILASAIFLQGFDRASQYSIDKTGRELLFLPLQQQTKQKTKVFIDIFVNRLFRGIAGLMLLFFIYMEEFSLQQISYVIVAAIGVWVILGLIARVAYVDKFRISLQKRYIDLDKITLNLDESVTYRSVKEMLQSDNPTRIIYGLRLLENSRVEKATKVLADLLTHNHREIRLRALKLLQAVDAVNFTTEVEPLLDDDEPEIRLEAVYYLCRHSKEEPEKAMQFYLEHEDDKLKSAALGCIHKHGQGKGPEVDSAFIEKALKSEGKDAVVIRAQLAQVLGYVDNQSQAVKYLSILLKDQEQIVVREALKIMDRLKGEAFLGELYKKLKDSDFSIEVQQVLASYGTDYFDGFKETFADESVEIEIRQKIPGIFAKLAKQKSADYLIAMLQQPNPALRYHVVKALNNLKKKRQSLKFDKDKIRAVFEAEARGYFELLSIKMVQKIDIPNNILIIALKEKMDQAIERLFRLAGLLHDQQDIYGSYLALVSNDDEASAASIEFVDNILDQDDKKYIFPIIDSQDEEEKLEKGRELFELPVDGYEQGMLELLKGDDIWLKACAIFSVSATCPEALQQQVRQSSSSNNALIKETAEYVLKRNHKK